jgi:hypothetical protein
MGLPFCSLLVCAPGVLPGSCREIGWPIRNDSAAAAALPSDEGPALFWQHHPLCTTGGIRRQAAVCSRQNLGWGLDNSRSGSLCMKPFRLLVAIAEAPLRLPGFSRSLQPEPALRQASALGQAACSDRPCWRSPWPCGHPSPSLNPVCWLLRPSQLDPNNSGQRLH